MNYRLFWREMKNPYRFKKENKSLCSLMFELETKINLKSQAVKI